jgi:glucose dehydrogenase
MKRLSRLFMVVASLGLGAACSNNSSAPASGEGAKPAASSAVPDADKQWTMPNKNQSATRYSAVSEINSENVKNLKVAWSFSTGVLRGHEGEPLVVGNTMFVHTPFPNLVYALDLSKEGRRSNGSTHRNRIMPSSRLPAATRSIADWPTATASSS